MKKKNNSVTNNDRGGKARGPVQRDAQEVMAELVAKLSQKLAAIGPDERRRRAAAGNARAQPGPADRGCGSGRQVEQLLHGGFGRGETDGGRTADNPTGLCGILPVVGGGASGYGSGDALGLGAGCVVASCGHEVLVANPRQMEGPKRRKRKNDRIDAHQLARVGRMDPQSLFPIEHRSVEVRQDLVAVRARPAAGAVRTDLINTPRGLGKSMGGRLPKCSSPSFPHKVEEMLPAEGREVLLPLVRLVETLSKCIQEYDERIEKLGRAKYPHTKLLRQVKGVGPITALAYALTLENPERFAQSREVGPYLGLVPKQEDSGDSQPQRRITKRGDMMVRQLLVGSAHYILGPFGPDTR